jgi:hypothetical protein
VGARLAVRRRIAVCVAAVLLAAAARVDAQTSVVQSSVAQNGVAQNGAVPSGAAEYDVKAAYLYNFARFVEWPAAAPHRQSEATVDICVLGQDPFGTRLDAMMADATVRGRKLATRRLASATAVAGCHVLFVSASERQQVPQILATLARADVLTVSDMPEFVRLGGMLQFVVQGNRVRFDVNLPACEAAGLRVSSDLLRVASTVRKAP